MHMFEWPSVEFWKQKICEKLVLNLFWKIWIFRVHLDCCYNYLFVASPKCWYCSGSHIFTYTIFQIYQESNSLKICSLVSGVAESLVFLGKSGFPGYSGPGPETPGCKGLNTFYRGQKVPFTLFTVWPCPSFPRRLPSSPSKPLGDFHLPPSESSEGKGLRAPRCGDRRSTQDLKDWNLSPSLSQGISKGAFPDLLS
jgi:hypothetical protein